MMLKRNDCNSITLKTTYLTIITILVITLIIILILNLDFFTRIAYAEISESDNEIYDYLEEEYNTNTQLNIFDETNGYQLDIFGDDPIINYIPKDLFLTENTTLEIYDDYGFFIHSFRDRSYYQETALDNMHSFVLVFAIEYNVEIEGFATIDRFSYTIRPLFQREYFAVLPNGTSEYVSLGFFSNANIVMNDEHWEDFLYATYGWDYVLRYQMGSEVDITTGVVAPAPQRDDDVSYQCGLFYDEINLFNIADITIAASIFNGQDLNESDNDYNVLNDQGNFIIRTGVDIKAIDYNNEYNFDDITRDTGFFVLNEMFSMVIGCVPVIGTSINTAWDIAEFIKETEGHYSCNQFETVEYSSYYASSVYANSKNSQMELTGGRLCKSSAISTTAMDGVEAWMRVGDFFTGTFEVSGSTGNDPGWYTMVKSSIALSVKCLISDFQTTTISSDFFTDYYNELRSKPISENVQNEAYLMAHNEKEEWQDSFLFEAPRNGWYALTLDNAGGINYQVEANDIICQPVSDNTYYFSEGQEYIIKLFNNTSSLKRPTIEIGLVTLEAEAGDIYTFEIPATNNLSAIKIDITDPFMQISISGSGSAICGITDTAFSPETPHATLSLYQIGSGSKYLWVQNNSGQSQSITLSFSDIATASVGSDGSFVTENVNEYYYTLYKFDLDDRYIYCFDLICSNAEPSPDCILYNSAGVINTANRYPSTDNIKFSQLLNVGDGILYVALRGSNSYSFTIATSGEAGDWYINDQLASTYCFDDYGAVVLEQVKDENTSYEIQYITKSGIAINELNYIGDNVGITFNSNNGILTIAPNSPYARQNIYFVGNNNVEYPLKLTFTIRRGPNFYFEYNRSPLLMKLHYDAASPLQNVIVTAGSHTYNIDCTNLNGVIDLSSQIKTDFYDACVMSATFSVSSYTMFYSEITTITAHPGGHLSTSFDLDSYSTGLIPFAGGSGGLFSPYQITNREELEYMGRCNTSLKSFALMNDIDLSGEYWTPIPNFEGLLFCNNYTISNMRIHISSTSNEVSRYGFFAYNSGYISNAVFTNAYITASNLHYVGWNDVGIIAGYNAGYIDSCRVNGTLEIHRNNSNIGGIAGENGQTITNSTLGELHSSKVMGNGEIGGIAGKNTSLVSDCHVFNTEINFWEAYQGRSIGGIVGYNPSGTIRDCGILSSTFIFSGIDNGENAWLPNFGYIAGSMEGDSELIRVGKTDDVSYDFSAVIPNIYVPYATNWFKGGWGETGYRAATVYVE